MFKVQTNHWSKILLANVSQCCFSLFQNEQHEEGLYYAWLISCFCKVFLCFMNSEHVCERVCVQTLRYQKWYRLAQKWGFNMEVGHKRLGNLVINTGWDNTTHLSMRSTQNLEGEWGDIFFNLFVKIRQHRKIYHSP